MIRQTINKRALSTIRRIFDNPQSPILDVDPVQLLFTQYLDKPVAVNNIALKSMDKPEKTSDYKVPRSVYTQFLLTNPTGTITKHSFKTLQLTIIPLNFTKKTPISHLYKLLQKENPDLIMMQLHPDRILADFQLIKKGKTNIFSNTQYWKQICRKGFDVMPSGQARKHTANVLKNTKIRLKAHMGEYKRQYDTETSRLVQPYRCIHTLNTQAVSTVSFFSEWNRIPIALSALPQTSQRQFLANSLTLMELQLLFKQTCEQLPMYPKGTTPKSLAQYLFPEILLHYSTRYMATLLQYLAALNQYKKVLLVTGLLESHTLPMYLHNRTVSTILADILPPKPKGSVMRDVSNHEVVEKHCLLDVLQYGKDILKTPLSQLQTTSTFLKYYLGTESANQAFRVDMYHKYTKIINEATEIGQTLKQQEFIRNVL